MDLEKANFDYSMKNIPIPHRDVHMRGTINKTEEFLQRLRWKVHFFENPPPPNKLHKVKETYGFNTTRNAPQSKSLIDFEHDMTHLIANLEYTDYKSKFQRQLSKDVKDIRKSNKVFVSADKTSNFYKLSTQDYSKLIRNNVTAHY